MTEPSTDSVGRSPSGSVGVISKVLLILEALQNSSVGLGLKAICDATGINKGTAHRFLKHLEREGYLLRTEVGAYLIGPRLAQMSACASRSATLQAVARPILTIVEIDSTNRKSRSAGSWNAALCGRNGKLA
jgi:hypothetical protein